MTGTKEAPAGGADAAGAAHDATVAAVNGDRLRELLKDFNIRELQEAVAIGQDLGNRAVPSNRVAAAEAGLAKAHTAVENAKAALAQAKDEHGRMTALLAAADAAGVKVAAEAIDEAYEEAIAAAAAPAASAEEGND